MKHLIQECGFTAFLLLGGAFLYRETFFLPPPRFEPMGPAFFPQFLLIGIMILCFWNLALRIAQIYRSQKESTQATQTVTTTSPLTEQQSNNVTLFFWRVPAVAGLFTLYVSIIAFTDIPYLILSLIFSVFLSFLLSGWNKRALVVITLSSLGLIAFIYVIFGLLLQSFFP